MSDRLGKLGEVYPLGINLFLLISSFSRCLPFCKGQQQKVSSRGLRYRKMEKGNPQLAFVSLKSVRVRGTEGSKELKSDVTSFQNMLTCGGANCGDNVPFICLGSQLVMIIKPFAGCTGEADSSLAPKDRRCKGQLQLTGYRTLIMTYCLLRTFRLTKTGLGKTV